HNVSGLVRKVSLIECSLHTSIIPFHLKIFEYGISSVHFPPYRELNVAFVAICFYKKH
ncbi:hypothetical protein X975_04699, partial [Stegodyphus mimosarum]